MAGLLIWKRMWNRSLFLLSRVCLFSVAFIWKQLYVRQFKLESKIWGKKGFTETIDFTVNTAILGGLSSFCQEHLSQMHTIKKRGWIFLWCLPKWLCAPRLAALVVSHSARQSCISGFRQELRPGATPSVTPQGWFESYSYELSLTLLSKRPWLYWGSCENNI